MIDNEDLLNFTFGSFFVQKICPLKVWHPPAAKLFFLNFRLNLSPHIFGLK